MTGDDHLAALRRHGVRVDAALFDPRAELHLDARQLEDDGVQPIPRPLQGARRGVHDRRCYAPRSANCSRPMTPSPSAPPTPTRHSSSASRRHARPRRPRLMRRVPRARCPRRRRGASRVVLPVTRRGPASSAARDRSWGVPGVTPPPSSLTSSRGRLPSRSRVTSICCAWPWVMALTIASRAIITISSRSIGARSARPMSAVTGAEQTSTRTPKRSPSSSATSAKRSSGRRRRPGREVRHESSGRVERAASDDQERMLGVEVKLESLGADDDEGQILRQPIVQIARQPRSLLVQRSRRHRLTHLGMSPQRDRRARLHRRRAAARRRG